MAVRKILLIGEPELYRKSEEVQLGEMNSMASVITDLHDTLMDFRQKNGAGLAIAAPQIGVMKRLIYIYIDQPLVLINPKLKENSRETFQLWDYCMSAPELMVKVKRFLTVTATYINQAGEEKELKLKGERAALIQHEYDHLEGVLSVAKAINERSFAHRSLKNLLLNQEL